MLLKLQRHESAMVDNRISCLSCSVRKNGSKIGYNSIIDTECSAAW